MRKCFLLLIVTVILVSCIKEKSDFVSMINDAKEIHCIELTTDNLLGTPMYINSMYDNLIYADYFDNYLGAIFNINERKITHRFLKLGQGPNELLRPVAIEVDEIEKRINVLQRQNGVLTSYKYEDILNNNFTPSRKLEFGRIDMLTETKQGFISAGFYENGSIGIFDNEGNLKNTVDVYPDCFSAIKDITNKYILGQGRIHYNKQNNTFVFASYYTGEIKFYNLTDQYELNIIKSYSSNQFNINNLDINNHVNIHETAINYSLAICSSNNHLYVLYAGANINDMKNRTFSYILKFNFKGQFMNCYKTDYRLSEICCDAQGESLYGFSYSKDLDPVFVKMVIPPVVHL
jgi:hypothetical protein